MTVARQARLTSDWLTRWLQAACNNNNNKSDLSLIGNLLLYVGTLRSEGRPPKTYKRHAKPPFASLKNCWLLSDCI